MKKIIIVLVLMVTTNSWSQKLEKVYGFAQEMQDVAWYQTQQKLWKAEIDKSDKNGEAWLNYYRAVRALRHLMPHENGSWDQAVSDKYFGFCNEIMINANKAIPNSFEAYVISGAEKGLTGNGGEDYKKAAELRPDDPEILDEMMIYYDQKQDIDKKEYYAKKMFDINYMSAYQLNWGYNILSELDENAILFTMGDNDTYATWIIQAQKQFRKDVTVINLYLIQLDEYRDRILKSLGYPPLKIDRSKSSTYEESEKINKKIYDHILKGTRPVYFVNSKSDFTKSYDDKLYLTGLATKHCETEIDNMAIIKRNFEKRYLLDYLTEVFSTNITDNTGKWFNAMYLPAMIKLYQHYKDSEDIANKNELEILMLKIARQSGQLEEVNKILGR
jgi:hypothetical protein